MTEITMNQAKDGSVHRTIEEMNDRDLRVDLNAVLFEAVGFTVEDSITSSGEDVYGTVTKFTGLLMRSNKDLARAIVKTASQFAKPKPKPKLKSDEAFLSEIDEIIKGTRR